MQFFTVPDRCHCCWLCSWLLLIVPGHCSWSSSLFLVMFLIRFHCSWTCCWFIFIVADHAADSYSFISWSCCWCIFIVPDHVPDSYSMFQTMFLIHINCSWPCFWFIFLVPDSCSWFILLDPDNIPDDQINSLYSLELSFFLSVLSINIFFFLAKASKEFTLRSFRRIIWYKALVSSLYISAEHSA